MHSSRSNTHSFSTKRKKNKHHFTLYIILAMIWLNDAPCFSPEKLTVTKVGQFHLLVSVITWNWRTFMTRISAKRILPLQTLMSSIIFVFQQTNESHSICWSRPYLLRPESVSRSAWMRCDHCNITLPIAIIISIFTASSVVLVRLFPTAKSSQHLKWLSLEIVRLNKWVVRLQ